MLFSRFWRVTDAGRSYHIVSQSVLFSCTTKAYGCSSRYFWLWLWSAQVGRILTGRGWCTSGRRRWTGLQSSWRVTGYGCRLSLLRHQSLNDRNVLQRQMLTSIRRRSTTYLYLSFTDITLRLLIINYRKVHPNCASLSTFRHSSSRVQWMK